MKHATSAAMLIVLSIVSIELVVRLSQPVLSKNESHRSNPSSIVNPVSKKPGSNGTPAKPRLAGAFGKVPLQFEANHGQTDGRVKFMARGPGYGLFLTSTEAVLHLQNAHPGASRVRGFSKTQDAALRMRIVGAARHAKVNALDRLPGTINYFGGNDSSKWITNIQAYQKVQYENVYPGADLIFYGNQQQLEYDFRLAPGFDPRRIRLALSDARKIRIDHVGDVVITTAAGDVRMHKPDVYQEENNSRQQIAGKFVIKRNGEIGFKIGKYDRTKLLIVDPVLSYSNVISGDGANVGNGIAADANGNAYIVGTTSSINFPTMNPFQATRAGFNDVFVRKLNPAGTVVYSTFLGGSNDDLGRGIAIDSAGNAYVTGWTFSTNFPTANVFQSARSAAADAFVTKLNAAGSALVYSTYLGGNGDDRAYAIAVDSSNNAYVTGQAFSSNFPTANAFQAARNGTGDVFVTKFNPAGSALVYSTYLGGSQSFEIGNGIAADADGKAYVVGQTQSTDFPVVNAFQSAKGDASTSLFDAFVTKFSPTGSPSFATYLGGNGDDVAYGVALDSSRNVYVTGTTSSFNFPIKNAVQGTPNGNEYEAFVTELNSAGNGLVYSTFLGGNADDTAYGIAVDPTSGKAVVVGKTTSPDFPAVRSLQSIGGGGVFQSYDAAGSWNFSNTGLTSPFGSAPAQNVNALAIDPLDSSIYAGTASGMFKSAGGVLPWTAVNQNYAVYSVAVESQNPAIVYAGNFGRVSKSIDAGKTWTDSSAGLPSESANALAIDPSNESIVYAATGIVGGGVYKSIDGGITWSAAKTGLPNLGANTLVIDPTTPSTLYVGIGTSTSSSAGVYKSTNSGGSWTQVSTGLSNTGVRALSFNPATASSIYAATLRGLYKSTNGGASWSSLLQTGFELLSLAVDPNSPSTIYLGSETFSGQGVLKSTDGGATWIATGLTDTRVVALIIDPFDSTLTAACGGLTTSDPSTDMFVAALDTGGSSLLFSSYLGGTARDEGHGIAFDSAANVYITGFSYSSDFPIVAGGSALMNIEDITTATWEPSAQASPSPFSGTVPSKDLATSTADKIGGSFGTDCPPIRFYQTGSDHGLQNGSYSFSLGASGALVLIMGGNCRAVYLQVYTWTA